MSGALGTILSPPPSRRGGSMPRYSATIAISSARRRRWPLRRSVTAEGERPSALARPLRVLPVCLSPARIHSTVNVLYPLIPAGRRTRWHTLTTFPKNRKQKIDFGFPFSQYEQNKNILWRLWGRRIYLKEGSS